MNRSRQAKQNTLAKIRLQQLQDQFDMDDEIVMNGLEEDDGLDSDQDQSQTKRSHHENGPDDDRTSQKEHRPKRERSRAREKDFRRDTDHSTARPPKGEPGEEEEMDDAAKGWSDIEAEYVDDLFFLTCVKGKEAFFLSNVTKPTFLVSGIKGKIIVINETRGQKLEVVPR